MFVSHTLQLRSICLNTNEFIFVVMNDLDNPYIIIILTVKVEILFHCRVKLTIPSQTSSWISHLKRYAFFTTL